MSVFLARVQDSGHLCCSWEEKRLALQFQNGNSKPPGRLWKMAHDDTRPEPLEQRHSTLADLPRSTNSLDEPRGPAQARNKTSVGSARPWPHRTCKLTVLDVTSDRLCFLRPNQTILPGPAAANRHAPRCRQKHLSNERRTSFNLGKQVHALQLENGPFQVR